MPLDETQTFDSHAILAAVQPNRDRYQQTLAKPQATLRYLMFFTARSGSTMLGDALSRTDVAGLPDEYFNPELLGWRAADLGVSTLGEYCEAVTRDLQTPNKVFGVEATYGHIMTFGDNASDFLRSFGADAYFGLIRSDIVAQAVSLFKATTYNVYHSPLASQQDLRASDEAFAYDAETIEFWIRHLLADERGLLALPEFTSNPVFLYEDVTRNLGGAVTAILRHLGLPTDVPTPASAHTKIGTAKNDEFVARFKRERAAFMDGVDRERLPLLAITTSP